MADSSPVTSPSRALRLGYRLRWLYLSLVVFGALLWWGMYPGDVLWQQAIGRGSNPVLHLMNMVAFFWGLEGGRGWFSYDAGMARIWGWPDDWYRSFGYGGYFPVETWIWWALGAFGLPSVIAGLILGFVGFSRRSSVNLPAKHKTSFVALISTGMAGSLLVAAAVLTVLHLTGLLEAWDEAWGQLQRSQRFAHHVVPPPAPQPPFWPLRSAWLLVASVIPVVLAVRFLIIQRETYWQLERITRVVGIGSGVLLAFSLVAGLAEIGPRDHYWDLHIDLWRTVWFSASTALLWAAACRVWLLFRLVKYEKQRVAMMTESPVCFACEYDLSGSLRGGVRRCPECGVAVPGEVVERFGAAADLGNGVVETEGAGVGE